MMFTTKERIKWGPLGPTEWEVDETTDNKNGNLPFACRDEMCVCVVN